MTLMLTSDNNLFAIGSLVLTNTPTTAIGPGDGTSTYSMYPVKISTPLGSKTITDVSVSLSNVIALTSDGSLYSFGDPGTNTVRHYTIN